MKIVAAAHLTVRSGIRLPSTLPTITPIPSAIIMPVVVPSQTGIRLWNCAASATVASWVLSPISARKKGWGKPCGFSQFVRRGRTKKSQSFSAGRVPAENTLPQLPWAAFTSLRTGGGAARRGARSPPKSLRASPAPAVPALCRAGPTG